MRVPSGLQSSIAAEFIKSWSDASKIIARMAMRTTTPATINRARSDTSLSNSPFGSRFPRDFYPGRITARAEKSQWILGILLHYKNDLP